MTEEAPSRERLSDQVAAVVRSRIYKGELAPGDRITEMALAAEFNVSRAPVREALAVLQKEGMIEALPYRGAVVARLSDRDVEEIRELRIALEGLAARRAATLARSEVVRELRDAYSEMIEAVQDGDSSRASIAHLDFHRAIAVASGLPQLVAILDQLAARSLALQGWAGLGSTELAAPAEAHLEVIEAFESGSPDAVVAKVVENICAPNSGIDRLVEKSTRRRPPSARV